MFRESEYIVPGEYRSHIILVKERPTEGLLCGLAYSAVFSSDRPRPRVLTHVLIPLYDLRRGRSEQSYHLGDMLFSIVATLLIIKMLE